MQLKKNLLSCNNKQDSKQATDSLLLWTPKEFTHVEFFHEPDAKLTD
jgi:hypothetical protein